jgi:hypothetical protein
VGEHFGVEVVAQAGERGHEGLGIGVFGLKIRGHLRVLLFAEPGVVVAEGDAVEVRFFGFFAGDGGSGERGFGHCPSSVVEKPLLAASS